MYRIFGLDKHNVHRLFRGEDDTCQRQPRVPKVRQITGGRYTKLLPKMYQNYCQKYNKIIGKNVPTFWEKCIKIIGKNDGSY